MTNLIFEFSYRVYRKIRRIIVTSRLYKKITYSPKSRDDLFRFWQQPWEGGNLPEHYLRGKAKSRFLLQLIENHSSDKNIKILEIGCNVGRNLNRLFEAGFRNLEAIEISEKAVKMLEKSFPEMAAIAKINNLPVEEKIKEFKDNEFDIVYTMAVLEHIHNDSKWIFPEIVRIAKTVITIEDEHGLSWRHFPRNYKKIFELLGMNQVYEMNCAKIDMLGSNFFARVFKKNQ
jgi:SAM-dependent methyltransferase